MALDRMTALEIQKIRSTLGMTQTEFAEELGVSQVTVSLWESGDRSPGGPATILIRQLDGRKKSRKKFAVLAK